MRETPAPDRQTNLLPSHPGDSMRPAELEYELFFKLQRALFCFVNQRLKVIPRKIVTPRAIGELPPEERVQIRDALSDHRELIDTFVHENPSHLPQVELEIVRSWQHMVVGEFFVMRYLQQHALFLSTASPAVVYGVRPLYEPFENLIGPRLPVLLQAVLLPFRDHIVYDGNLLYHNMSFGPGIRRSLQDGLKAARERQGVVTTLPAPTTHLLTPTPALPVAAPRSQPKPKPKPKTAPKQDRDAVVREILELIDRFCREHLNAEYAMLCRELTGKLARKRPCPLLKGAPNAWASGIIRAIGGVNFLHDPTQTPHLKSTEIDQHLGVGTSTAAARLAEIRKYFKMFPLDPAWTLPSHLESNPMVWMIKVNGMLVDARALPREIQEQAFLQGVIPYLPDSPSSAESDGD